MKHHLTETHEHTFEIHNRPTALSSQSISLFKYPLRILRNTQTQVPPLKTMQSFHHKSIYDVPKTTKYEEGVQHTWARHPWSDPPSLADTHSTEEAVDVVANRAGVRELCAQREGALPQWPVMFGKQHLGWIMTLAWKHTPFPWLHFISLDGYVTAQYWWRLQYNTAHGKGYEGISLYLSLLSIWISLHASRFLEGPEILMLNLRGGGGPKTIDLSCYLQIYAKSKHVELQNCLKGNLLGLDWAGPPIDLKLGQLYFRLLAIPTILYWVLSSAGWGANM